MIYRVHVFYSSVTNKFDHKTPQVLLSPQMEISPIPDILSEKLNLIKVRQNTVPILIQRSIFILLQALTTQRSCDLHPRFQQSSRLLQPNLTIIFTHSPDSDTHLGCLWFMEGQLFVTEPLESHPLHLLAKCEQ